MSADPTASTAEIPASDVTVVYVVDASAMIAFLRQEPGHQVFRATLRKPEVVCHAHGANLAEVFYDFRRSDSEDVAQSMLADLAVIGVRVREDFDRPFWLDAARTKADYRRVALADCLGLALTRRLDATFLTADRHELESVAAAGVCRVQFIR